MTMKNGIVCSQEVQRKSKLMFELYMLHLPTYADTDKLSRLPLVLLPPFS